MDGRQGRRSMWWKLNCEECNNTHEEQTIQRRATIEHSTRAARKRGQPRRTRLLVVGDRIDLPLTPYGRRRRRCKCWRRCRCRRSGSMAVGRWYGSHFNVHVHLPSDRVVRGAFTTGNDGCRWLNSGGRLTLLQPRRQLESFDRPQFAG